MPTNYILSYMSRDQFQELYMRARIHREEARGPCAKVSKLYLIYSRNILTKYYSLGRRSLYPFSEH